MVELAAHDQTILDCILHRFFPDRLPGEMDDADLPRVLRMIEALGVMAIEDKRAALLAGEIEPAALTPADWSAIKAHDALMASAGDEAL